MKTGLIGFGKAGKAVASVILQHPGFSLEWVLKNRKTPEYSSAKEFLGVSCSDPGLIYASEITGIEELLHTHPVDVIIDFSNAKSIYTYGKIAAEKNITILSAISHYGENEKEYLKTLSAHTVVFWSPNITLGVNYLLFAASLLKTIVPEVDIEVIEEHFKTKPGISGTAVKIAETLDLETENINSIRVGGIVGKHEVIFGLPYQTIRLVHESISREAFGNGALFAAEHIKGKPNGFYTFEDILKPYFYHSPHNP